MGKQGNTIERGASNEKAGRASLFHPQLLGFGFFVAGLFFQMDNGSAARIFTEGPLFSASLTFPAAGALAAAIILLVSLRNVTFSQKTITAFTATWITGITISVTLLCMAKGIPSQHMIGYAGLILLGACIPLAISSWMIAYRALSLRSIMINAALAFFACGLVIAAGTLLNPTEAFFAAIACLLIGSFSCIRSWPKMPEQNPKAAPLSTETVRPSPVQLILSVPVIGVAISSFTTGSTYVGSASPSVEPYVACGIAALVVLGFSLTSITQWKERKLSYIAFGISLPAIAAFALIIKMIPIDFIASEWFRDYMFVLFQLYSLATWIYLSYLSRISRRSVISFSCLVLIVSSSALLLGCITSIFGYPWNKGIMGLATAAFLVFATIELGRSIILYNKGTETKSELTTTILDLESTCEIIGTDYKLSPREIEVLVELAYGHASSYVAKVLYISNNTARTHMKNIYKKLDVGSREDLLELIRKVQKGS
ncbi:MAG: helix-turn-helix transcriptional regulator [Raoultibacter sp.]